MTQGERQRLRLNQAQRTSEYLTKAIAETNKYYIKDYQKWEWPMGEVRAHATKALLIINQLLVDEGMRQYKHRKDGE